MKKRSFYVGVELYSKEYLMLQAGYNPQRREASTIIYRTARNQRSRLLKLQIHTRKDLQ